MIRPTIVSIVCLLTACSSYQPPDQAPAPKSKAIAVPTEQVWQSVIRYFGEHNVPIENLEHSSFFIKTKPVDLQQSFASATYAGANIPMKNEWCDCGKGSIGNVWSSKQQISVSFNIILRQLSPTETETMINVFFEGVKLGKRNAFGSGPDVSMKLECVSTGRIERELLQFFQAADH